jgi:phosphatidate cytidylyltransferase
MRTRILSGLVGIALFLGLCFGGLLPFTLGVTALAALAAYEWVTAYRHAPPVQFGSARKELSSWQAALINGLPAFGGLVLPLVSGYGLSVLQSAQLPFYDLTYLLIPILLFTLMTVRAGITGRVLGRFRDGYGIVGMLYIDFLMTSFVWLRGLPGRIVVRPFGEADRGAWLMLFVAVCVWASDTFAYFVGRGLGKHKLAPTLSPQKTVEGAVGGLLGAMAVGAAFGPWIHLPLLHGLAVGAIAGTMGQVGDLFESALKREIGIKDFGRIMPGHGGVLDRFDSLLFVAPLAYLYLCFVAGI